NKSGGTATMQDSTAGHVTNDDGATFSATGGQLASADNSGTMTLGSGNVVTGDVIQKAGSLTLDGDQIDGTLTADGGQLTVTGNGSKAGSLTGALNAQLDGSLELTKASGTYDGVLSGNGGLTVSGGTETLTGNQTYTGATSVTQDGGLALKGSLVSALTNAGTTQIDGGKLTAATINTGTLTAEKGTLADLANRAGTATLNDSTAGHVTNDDGAAFSATGGQLASAENSGTMTLGKGSTVTGDVTQKAGDLTLDGNQIDGMLTVDGGQFTVADDDATADAVSGRLYRIGNGGGIKVGSLTGAGNGRLNNTLELTKASGTYSGVLSGKGGLSISGGHETLTGANTYTGDTDVGQNAGLTLTGSVAGALNNAGTADIDGGRVDGTTTNTGTLKAQKATLTDVANKSGGTATMQDSTAGHVTNDDGATF
ncbi:autotransporter outer membrane beta-barrel domain-containing protein, partial [Acetobacteraceae bacterium B3987]|nr:autotransporter outer membrane beta-barrel domain-containing protein [Acetobacteraceae bacterium B3987]